MKAVLLQGPGEVTLRDHPIPTLQGGDLLVEMKACGLCGSDLEKIHGEYTTAPPVIGHEAVGVVASIGEGAEGFEKGQRVFPHHHVPCYECHLCLKGSETMCPQYRRWHLDPGGFAEYFRVPAWNVEHGGVLVLPDSMSFDEGSFIEPLACCIRALDRFRVQQNSTALIAGAGPMGLLVLQLLPHYGVHQVIVSEVSRYRIDRAAEMGADAVLNPLEEDVPERVGELTEGQGVDVAVVASGNPQALRQAVQSVRPGGTVGLIGIPEAGSSLEEVSELVTREVSIISSNAATVRETRRALEMINEGAIDVRSLVTHRIHLEDFTEALELVRKAEALKVVIVP